MAGKFRAYNRGPEGNMRVYGQKDPPDYDLSKVTTQVALLYGTRDPLASLLVRYFIKICFNFSQFSSDT